MSSWQSRYIVWVPDSSSLSVTRSFQVVSEQSAPLLKCLNRRYSTTQGDTWRYLWIAYWPLAPVRQSSQPRFLLAINDQGCCRGGSHMRSLPKTMHNPIMATPALGDRHCRTSAHSPRELKMGSSSSWILYQVDRSQTNHKHIYQHNKKVLLAKHHLSLQRPERHNSRQWQIDWKWHVQGVLPLYQHKCITPSRIELSSAQTASYSRQ